MATHTGENEQALRKILDMTRLISIVLLALHFYYYCHAAFNEWKLASQLSDRLLDNIRDTGLFDNFHTSKLMALGFLVVSLLGSRGRKDEKLDHKTAFAYTITGLMIYFFGYLSLLMKIKIIETAMVYMGITTVGFLLVLSGGTLFSRIIRNRLDNRDVFNRENETFPQEERLLENQYSVNLPARYRLKNRERNSWINIINPFRALMVLGSPGSGKSYFVIRHVITHDRLTYGSLNCL